MMSAPASTKSWCSAAIVSGAVSFEQFRRLAGLQPHREQIGAGGAVGEQHALFGEQRFDRIGHGTRFQQVWNEIRI